MDSQDRDFIDRLERCALGAAEFGHREHVRAAWLYLRRDGAGAHAAMAQGLKALSTAHGAPGRYHETLTRLWVEIVAEAARRDPEPVFDRFIARHPELLDRDLPSRHYSRERLASDDARAAWVEPDLEPLAGERWVSDPVLD